MSPILRPLAVLCLLASLLFATATGCGNPSRGTIRGKVALDGQPVERGAIRFVPIDGKSPTAGAEIKDGQYKAEVPLGNLRVEITAPKVVGQRKAFNTPDSPTVDVTKEMIPARYNTKSELTVDVPAGTTTRDFDLKSP